MPNGGPRRRLGNHHGEVTANRRETRIGVRPGEAPLAQRLQVKLEADDLAFEVEGRDQGRVQVPHPANAAAASPDAGAATGVAEGRCVRTELGAVTGQGDTSLLPLHELAVPAEGLRIAALLTAAGITPSNSEANRKLKERAVKVDGAVVEDPGLAFGPGFEGVLQVGKRDVNISAIEPVGMYAVKLVFSDGHDTGIYSWEYLYELGSKHDANWTTYLARLKQAGKSREP